MARAMADSSAEANMITSECQSPRAEVGTDSLEMRLEMGGVVDEQGREGYMNGKGR